MPAAFLPRLPVEDYHQLGAKLALDGGLDVFHSFGSKRVRRLLASQQWAMTLKTLSEAPLRRGTHFTEFR
jgi:hypothetical protein